MTFEQLEAVNAKLKGIDVKGKDYVQVNTRVLAFRELYPNGTIKTEMVSLIEGTCIIKAEVYDDEKLLSTGYAYEKESSSFINKTSFIENCETSAVGRALGFIGIGIATSIGSAEEVQNAIVQQEAMETISENEATSLLRALTKADVDITKLCEQYEIKTLNELTAKQYADILRKLNSRK